MNTKRLKEIANNNAYGSDLIVPWSEVAQMARELLALQWTRITAENLPKVGDEVMRSPTCDAVVKRTNPQILAVTAMMLTVFTAADDWKEQSWAYRRPLNPPEAEQG